MSAASGRRPCRKGLAGCVSLCAPTQNVVPRPLVVTNVGWNLPNDFAELDGRDKMHIRDEPNGARLLRSLDPTLTGERNHQVTGWTDAHFKGAVSNRQLFSTVFGSQFIGHVTTQNRLQLVQQVPSPQFRRQTANLLHALYWKGKVAENAIKEAIKRRRWAVRKYVLVHAERNFGSLWRARTKS